MTRRIFRYLWRANAIVIFTGTCLLLVTLGPVLLRDIFQSFGRHEDPGPPVVQQTSPHQPPLTLGAFALVGGTNTGRAELSMTRSEIGFGSSGSYTEIRNILWVDLGTGAARWLLSDHMHVVAYHSDIALTSEAGQGSPVAWLFLIQSTDSQPTGGQLVATSPNGVHQEQIATGVRSVNSWLLKSSSEMVVIYQGTEGYRLASVDLNTLKKHSDSAVRIPPIN